ncbi:DnaJ-domain-containing protein [Coccomyxa subellipsoidea C-169]|uniref:DnaJ-domain-containing protein n=1 Tax=Coccomyxa subellipsoidea (strain C-169) TaxID=574566 RepID=I0YR49_COCSC|nr:DnaJ-domain-containing protein [Coccomyxa subellipsoidea C-169]EIE20868.1 DnaJ-domain-containing protein [Coccomyxa subellipsoidea C-169]|eukprot:XP_005645412.1 DnaJ-domain-containing protein [Coccomyxa subellipsoidea C-169]
MASLYEVLGIEETASLEEVKKAYRTKALEHHPDRNVGNASAHEAFRKVTEAYEVLRDASRRSSYDSLRRGLGGIGSQGPYSSSNWRPGADDFEEAFASWFERQGFKRSMDEQTMKERREATHRARAAAWEAEKAEAQANKERFERVRWRTRNARAVRHAQVLRRFWHTSQGLVWQDALVVVMLGLSLGLSAVQLRPAATADSSGKDKKGPGGGDPTEGA